MLAAALSWPLLRAHGRLLVTDTSTMAPFGSQIIELTFLHNLGFTPELHFLPQTLPDYCLQFSHSVESLWHMDFCTPGFPTPTPVESHVYPVIDAIQTSRSLSSPSPPAFNLFQHLDLSSESVLSIRWLKYWSFRLSISPSNEYSCLISSRIDWFDLLAVEGTLKSLLPTPWIKSKIL